jgi:hypothetical protein
VRNVGSNFWADPPVARALEIKTCSLDVRQLNHKIYGKSSNSFPSSSLGMPIEKLSLPCTSYGKLELPQTAPKLDFGNQKKLEFGSQHSLGTRNGF